jgi:transcriptional regulator GlxA family with amidase domain
LDERVLQAIDLMGSADSGRPITEAALAHAVCFSVSRFAYLFRLQTGVAPLRMLRSIRLQEAARLLLDTETALKKIADAVGFRTAAHFGRLFKVHYGVTPCEYRRNNGMAVDRPPKIPACRVESMFKN